MAEAIPLAAELRAEFDAFRREMRASTEIVKRSGDAMERSFDAADRSATALTKTSGILTSSMRLLGGALATIGLTAFTREANAAAREMIGLERAFTQIEGSSAAASETLTFLREQSDKLGQDFRRNAQSFQSLAAAAKGTSLEGEGIRQVFRDITEAGATLNLSNEKLEGTFTALEQSLSKGKIQAEELTGQLSERLPGAFQIAARSMNISTEELNKLLARGEVFSEDFIPKFAAQVRKEFAGPLDEFTVAAGKAQNAFRDALAEIGRVIRESPAIIKSLKAIGSALRAIFPPRLSQDAKALNETRKSLEALLALEPEIQRGAIIQNQITLLQSQIVALEEVVRLEQEQAKQQAVVRKELQKTEVQERKAALAARKRLEAQKKAAEEYEEVLQQTVRNQAAIERAGFESVERQMEASERERTRILEREQKERTRIAKREERERLREITQAQKERAREFEAFLGRVEGRLADLFQRALNDNVDVLETLRDSAFAILAQLAARFATTQLVMPAVAPFFGGGSLGGASTAIIGGGGAAGVGGAAGAAGGATGIAGFLGTTLIPGIPAGGATNTGFASGNASQFGGAATGGGGGAGLTAGGLLGGVGAGLGVGVVSEALLGQLGLRGPARTGLSGALGGATTGALIGTSIFPGVGTLIGAGAGALLGGGIGAALGLGGGKKRRPKFQIRDISIAVDDLFKEVIVELDTKKRDFSRGAADTMNAAIDEAITIMMQSVVANAASLPPEIQDTFRDPLDELIAQFREGLRGVNFDGKNLQKEFERFLQRDLPQRFQALFGDIAQEIEDTARGVAVSTELTNALDAQIDALDQSLLALPEELQTTFREPLDALIHQFRRESERIFDADMPAQLGMLFDTIAQQMQETAVGIQETVRRLAVSEDLTNALDAQIDALDSSLMALPKELQASFREPLDQLIDQFRRESQQFFNEDMLENLGALFEEISQQIEEATTRIEASTDLTSAIDRQIARLTEAMMTPAELFEQRMDQITALQGELFGAGFEETLRISEELSQLVDSASQLVGRAEVFGQDTARVDTTQNMLIQVLEDLRDAASGNILAGVPQGGVVGIEPPGAITRGTINVTINPAAGMSPRDIANEVIREIEQRGQFDQTRIITR